MENYQVFGDTVRLYLSQLSNFQRIGKECQLMLFAITDQAHYHKWKLHRGLTKGNRMLFSEEDQLLLTPEVSGFFSQAL